MRSRQQGGQQKNTPPCIGSSEVLDPHGSFKPLPNTILWLSSWKKQSFLPSIALVHCPATAGMVSRPEYLSNWKITLRGERRRWDGLVSVTSATYQAYWTLALKGLLKKWRYSTELGTNHSRWAKGLGETAFPDVGAQLGQFKFVTNYSLRMGLIVCGGTCFSWLTVKRSLAISS